MQTQTSLTQITFHYLDGHTESFSISNPEKTAETAQELRQELRRLFDHPWWIFHLNDQTVCVNTANVIKVEIKPAVPYLQGENVFSDAQRVTALTQSRRGVSS